MYSQERNNLVFLTTVLSQWRFEEIPSIKLLRPIAFEITKKSSLLPDPDSEYS